MFAGILRDHRGLPLTFFSYLISQGLVEGIGTIWPNEKMTLFAVMGVVLSFYEDYHVEKFLFCILQNPSPMCNQDYVG